MKPPRVDRVVEIGSQTAPLVRVTKTLSVPKRSSSCHWPLSKTLLGLMAMAGKGRVGLPLTLMPVLSVTLQVTPLSPEISGLRPRISAYCHMRKRVAGVPGAEPGGGLLSRRVPQLG